MWQSDYKDRLSDWVALRQKCEFLPLVEQLEAVNDWWYQAPIVNCTIRWNEQSFWPDPWELLTNLGYCDLARALGIAYTLMTVKKQNFTSLEIIETNQDNLVLVDSGKYILNWAPGTLLNIHSNPIEISRRINCSKLQSFLK